MKKALHINSYFLTNNIHLVFYKEIIKRKHDQFLIPVHKHFKVKDTADIAALEIDYVFDKLDKTVFFTKVFKVVSLFRKKKWDSFDYLHGHTLMSDGIPTYLISRLTKKDFVVSIRNTDITLFISRSWLFRSIGKHILKKAKAVFFISPSLREKIVDYYPMIDQSKFELLPNGLDPFWVASEAPVRQAAGRVAEPVKLLFIGEVIPRKNLEVLIKFLHLFQDRQYILQVVGKNTLAWNFDDLNKALSNGNRIIYHGEVRDKDRLKQLYDDSAIFVLLSHAETFGVVYIEALSRGLPIVFSKNEGMDGFFPEGTVGYSCLKDSPEELKKKVDDIIVRYDQMSKNAVQSAKQFNWETILDTYVTKIAQVMV